MAKKNRSLKKQNRALQEKIKNYEMDSNSPSGGWSNPFNQFGLQTDPTFNTSFLPPLEFTHRELTDLYLNPLIRKVIKLHKGDGTRKGLEITSDENTDLAQDVQSEMESRFNWMGLISKMIGIKHNYGGGVLYVDAEDGRDQKDPLNENAVRKINYFHPVERWLANPITGRPMLGDDKPGQPLHYQISLSGFMNTESFVAHESRVIRFPSYESDDVLSQRERARRNSWDVSTIQVIYDNIKRYGIGMQSMSQLLQRFVMDVFKVSNLKEFKDLERFRTYVREQMMLRNSMNAVIMGADDEISQQATPTTGMTEINSDIRMDVSMATDIPLSIFFSNESGNLGGSTTSEDRKTWYDNVQSNQNNQYTPLAREMVRFLSYEQGFDTTSFGYKWNSLWSHTPLEQSELEFKHAETDKIYVLDIGVPAEDVLEARWGSGEFSQAVPDFDKEDFEKELEEMEAAEIEREEADREAQKEVTLANSGEQESSTDEDDTIEFEFI